MSSNSKKIVDEFESLPLVDDAQVKATTAPRLPWFRKYAWPLGAALCALVIVLYWFFPTPAHLSKFVTGTTAAAVITSSTSACTPDRLSYRREWRSLSDMEKDDYIKAVQCLQSRPGLLAERQRSRFEDFAYSHSRTGFPSHQSALFLAWHRVFLSSFDATLRSECNYNGNIPYWDWSLDANDLASAPIWDTVHGFGGNGTVSPLPNGLPAVKNASCVTDGPFANMEVFYVSEGTQAHCLSRGFLTPGSEGLAKSEHDIQPDAIADLLTRTDYHTFWEELEGGVHDALPHYIQGDFDLFTAPNDPVFFLHHSQLDRLWRLWQLRDLNTRLTEYTGKSNATTNAEASLNDVIHTGGLTDDVSVNEIMDTKGGYLCYDFA